MTDRPTPPTPTPPTSTPRSARRARGKGHLYKRGAVWWIAVSFRGRQIRESTGARDRRRAQEYLDATLAALASAKVTGRGVLTPELRATTVRQRLEALLLDLELRGARAVAQARAHLGVPPPSAPARPPRHVLAAFGHWRVVDLSTEAIDDYIRRRLSEGARPATVNRETQLLGQAVRPFFERLGLPAPTFRRLREDNVRQGFCERADLERIVAALPPELRDLVWFAFLSSWRKHEILTLRWADVDREGGVIRLRPEHAKNGRGRILPLAGDLAALIERRWRARIVRRPDGTEHVAEFVFHRAGRPIGDFRRAWARACAQAGLAGRLFHDLRRSGIRAMVRAGVPERVAMELSGHRTRAVFDRYNIVSDGELRVAVERTTEYLRHHAAPSPVIPLRRDEFMHSSCTET